MDLCCGAKKHGFVRIRKNKAAIQAIDLRPLGQWITRLGRKPGEVAKGIGISEPYLSELISGKKKNVSFSIIANIADELGIPIDALRRPPPRFEAVQSVADLSPDVLRRLSRQSDK